MADHILLELAVRKPYRDTPDLLAEAEYDIEAGLWVLHGRPLIEVSPIFAGPVSKKMDQETGEDRKGE
ncbi:hypothetical protein [Microvirga sp. M2]|uniref:hypothetical protein n=1 Tax=Microvirga sp. M2 TaxID=3073270 RepID=UPI0039C14AB6